jgi:hypothetical protein
MDRIFSKLIFFCAIGFSQTSPAWTSLEPEYPGTSIPENSGKGYIAQPGGGGYTRIAPVTGASQTYDPTRRSYLLRESSDDTLNRLRNHLHEDDDINEMRRLEHRRRMESDD